MKKILLLMVVVVFSFGKMEFSEPKPTFDNPRLWVIKVNSSDLKEINHTIGAVNNVLKEYPMDTLKVAMIFYAKGMRLLRKDADPATLQRIDALMQYDVEMVACKNTMKTMKWTKKDFIDDLTYVQAGIAEVIERVASGWIEVTPY